MEKFQENFRFFARVVGNNKNYYIHGLQLVSVGQAAEVRKIFNNFIKHSIAQLQKLRNFRKSDKNLSHICSKIRKK